MNGGIIGKTCRGRGVYTIGDHLLNAGRSRIPERAIAFDGVDDYASLGCASLGAALGTGSIEAWVKCSYTSSSKVILGSTSDGSTMALLIQINRNVDDAYAAGYIRCFMRDFSGKTCAFATVTDVGVLDGRLHHLAVTFVHSSKTYKLYCDGVQVQTTMATPSVLSSFVNLQYPLMIGAINSRGTPTDFCPIFMDEIRFWTDVRTQDEIREYMRKRVIGTEGNLYGAWHLNEGQGTALADVMGNNNGTLNGGTWIDAADLAWWDEVSA